ncbi:apicomplexan specific membrane [Cryptosporidium sp. chipmunk genotype I]|uniref:apicomplexan specific membrane n=1 Tax=Cryptosporidium sp. chipmunk genotype I TaxID=1280935 RepID=UPI00351AA651|nr:apicomplexan specific membrane [Cryptosporidium sp. chipmunk genotype I]
MKLVRKVAGSKFLNKQPIVEVEPNIYAVRDEQSGIYKSVRDSRSLGVLTIFVERAIISPMGFNRSIRNFIVRENAEWVFELALQGQMLVSQPVSTKDFILEIPVNSPMLLSPNKGAGNNSLTFLDEKHESRPNIGVESKNSSAEREKDKVSGVGAREVFFNFKESFQITDISSDMNLDLICRVPIQCKPIINHKFNEEIVDEDCYFSKNSGSIFLNECDEDHSFSSENIAVTGSANADSTPNLGSNPPMNNTNHSVSFRINQEQSNSPGSSFKQYKIIRIEKNKPDCKEILDKPDGENRPASQEVPYQDQEWEVLYECIHFGKVTIPISSVFHNKLSKLPILDYSFYKSSSFYTVNCSLVSNILWKSRNPVNIQDHENALSKSNTMEEWTVIHGKKTSSCDSIVINKPNSPNLEEDSHILLKNTDNERVSRLRSRFKGENKTNDGLNSSLNEKDVKESNFRLEYQDKVYSGEGSQLEVGSDSKNLNWYHLYPKTSEMAKYVRPVPGITEYGLSNPIKTLGFIQIGLNFETECCSKISLLTSSYLSMVTEKPITRWILPSGFEPQYFQMYAESLKMLLEHYPRWVPKFFFLLNFRIPRSRFDRAMISLFWAISTFGAFKINSFFSFSWIFMVILPLLISLTYRFGSQIASRIHQDFLTRINLVEQERKSITSTLLQKSNANIEQKSNINQNNKTMNLINSTSGNIWKMLQPILNIKYHPSLMAGDGDFIEENIDVKSVNNITGREKKDSSYIKTADETSDKDLSKVIPKEVYFGDKIVGREYCTQYDLYNGDGYICLARTLNNSFLGNKEKGREEELRRLNLLSNDESDFPSQLEKQKWERTKEIKEDSRVEKSMEDKDKDAGRLHQNLQGSGGIVETPFGELRLGLRIPYDNKVVSIFFDDQDLEPIQTQLSNLLAIVELVQQSFASFSTFLMKLKNSLNFEDPLLPFLTLLILVSLTIILNLGLYIFNLITRSQKMALLLRGFLLVKFVHWLLMKDPFNNVQLEIFNKKQRIDPNIFGQNRIIKSFFNKYFKLISSEDRNILILLNSLKIYDYYPDRFVHRQGSLSKPNGLIERSKEKRRGVADPIRILSINIEEYLFFYAVKFACMHVLLLGSSLNTLQYIFTSKFSNIFARVLLLWWYVIPDIREIQHRCIASTQLIGNLDDLLNDNEDSLVHFKVINGNSYGIGGNNKVEESKPEASGAKADLFLKQFYFGKNSNYIKKSTITTSSISQGEQVNQESTALSGLSGSSPNKGKYSETGISSTISSKKSLIDYILPINKEQNSSMTQESESKGEKSSAQSSYEVLESLLEGIYPINKSKKQD